MHVRGRTIHWPMFHAINHSQPRKAVAPRSINTNGTRQCNRARNPKNKPEPRYNHSKVTVLFRDNNAELPKMTEGKQHHLAMQKSFDRIRCHLTCNKNAKS